MLNILTLVFPSNFIQDKKQTKTMVPGGCTTRRVHSRLFSRGIVLLVSAVSEGRDLALWSSEGGPTLVGEDWKCHHCNASGWNGLPVTGVRLLLKAEFRDVRKRPESVLPTESEKDRHHVVSLICGI